MMAMDSFAENEGRSARRSAAQQSDGIISRFFFHSAYPILKLGSQRPLTENDLPELGELESSYFNRMKIEKVWAQEVNSGRENLGRALFAEYIRSTWKAQLLTFINFIARIGQAWALGMLMEQFGKYDSNASMSEKVVDAKMGYFYAGLLVVCGLVAFPSKQHCFFMTYRKGLQLKVGLIATIYKKTLHLPSMGIDISNGFVTNLASNDVDRFLQTSVSAVFILVGPIASVLILILGIIVTGPAFAAGFSLLILLLPIQMYAGRKFAQFRSRVAALTDSRVSLVSQTVHGNRVMKFNGWEDSFREKIAHMRQQEVKVLYRASIFRAFNEALFYFTSLLVSVITFTIDVLANGNALSPKTVFTALTLFNMLQYILAKHLPSAVTGLSECYISCRRIQALLKLPEHSAQEVQEIDAKRISTTGEVLSLSHVSCHWDRASENDNSRTVALSDVSLSLEAGKLYCVIGVVGSGKSALLAALAGEMPVSEGKIKRKYTSLSYAVQDSWIMDATVRENIIMGSDFDQTWYDEVFKACGLNDDFCHGDSQILGDRGVQCSGGQRARIGLARTLYCDADILLLDDCLSAVDSKVARMLFYSAIQTLATKRGRCVVLATHQLQFCDDADCCIFVDKGGVAGTGSYSDCVAQSNGKLLHTTQTEAEQSSLHKTVDTADRETSVLPSAVTIADKAGVNGLAAEKNVQKEKRTTGVITMKTWKAYVHALGISTAFVLLALFAVTQAGQLLVIVIVGNWSGASADKQASYINNVLWLTSGVVLLSIARAYFTLYSLIKASKKLHNLMLSSVLRAKIEFFDTNPVGRILNRFSADVGICDETLPLTIYDFSVGLFVVVGSILTAVISLPFTLIALLPLVCYFIKLQNMYVKTTRELKRIEGMARSPIFAMISESLKGVGTIRCNGKLNYFFNKFEDIQSAHTKAAFAFTLCSRWFAFHLDIMSFIFTSVASFSAVLFHDQGWLEIQPSVLGLALTLLIQISTTNFPWIVRQSAVRISKQK
jgi:ATP-binding cassette subfamily C (CFTR/MRP) protein 4